MAKILLNVNLDAKQANAGLDGLKDSIKEIANSLSSIKTNKNLTSQLNALSKVYASLAKAAQKTAEAQSKNEIAEQKLLQATAKTEKAQQDAAAAAAKRATAEAKLLDVVQKRQRSEEQREQQEKRQLDIDQQRERVIASLTKSYAQLSEAIQKAMGTLGGDVAGDRLHALSESLGESRRELEALDTESDDFDDTANRLKTDLGNLQAQFASIKDVTYQYADMQKQASAAEKEAAASAKQHENALYAADESIRATETSMYNLLSTINSSEAKYAEGTFDDIKRRAKDLLAEIKNLNRSGDGFVSASKQIKKAGKEISASFAEVRSESEKTEETQQSLISQFSGYGAVVMVARTALREIKKVYEDISDVLVKTEDRVIEIRRVLNDDDMRTPEEISAQLYEIAREYGTTFDNAAEIAVKFARAGRTWNESLEATRAALLAVNVAELSADQASEGLLSIIQQYGLETSDLIDVVDKLNKISDKNPVTTEKMLYALQRAGSAAKNANISFEETLGLITSLSEATNRSGQNIGTAINSLIQYSTKNVDTFASLSEEAAKVVDQFKHGQASIVDVWKQVAVEIQNNKERVAELLSGDEMEELTSSLHDELGDLLTETEGVYSVANTYRKNYFIALLDNMDRYEKALEDTRETQGYSAKEQEQYMDTYTAKINSANAAWQEVGNTMQGILQLKKWFAELSEKTAESLRDFILYQRYLKEWEYSLGGRLGGNSAMSKEEFLASGEYYRMRYGTERASGKDLLKEELDAKKAAREARLAAIEAAKAAEEAADGTEKLTEATENLTYASEDLVDVAEKERKKFEELSDALDQAQSVLNTLTKAQEEYDESGELSVDTIQAITSLGAEYVDLLVDENGKINLNAAAIGKLIERQKDLLRQTQAQSVAEYAATTLNEYLTRSTYDMGDAAETASGRVELAAEAMMRFTGNGEEAEQAARDFAAALDALAGSKGVLGEDWEAEWKDRVMRYASDLSVLTGASGYSTKKTSSSSSSKSTDTSTADPELERLKDIVSLRESELSLLVAQNAEDGARLSKIEEIRASLSAQISYMQQAGAEQEELNRLLVEWHDWEKEIEKIREDAAERELKAYTDRLSLLQSELGLSQARGDDLQAQVETMAKIRDALWDEIEYLRSIGAAEEDINDLSAEWYEWQSKINDLYEKTLETARKLEEEAMQAQIDAILKEIDAEKEALNLSEKRLAVDRARATLEESIANAKTKYVSNVLSEYLTSLDVASTLEQKQAAVAQARSRAAEAVMQAKTKAVSDAFRAERQGASEVLSLEEKRLAVEEARKALEEVRENPTVKVYNEETGRFEWQANQQAVQSAEDKLNSAVDALNKAVENAAWDEVQRALENGSLTEKKLQEILQKWQAEGYGTGSSEYVSRITEAYRKAIGTPVAADTVSGQISGVQTAVDSLNEYLKSQAVKELEDYIEAGNTDADEMKAILDRWLSKGEGAEIWKWEEDLLSHVNEAIESGMYDDADVQTAIDGVKNAVDALREYMSNKFVSEVSLLIKTATAAELQQLIDKWRSQEDALNSGLIGWAERLVSAKLDQEEMTRMFTAAASGDISDADRASILDYMKSNAAAWHESGAEKQKQLSDVNYALGTALGLNRADDGVWRDADGQRVFDRGGVLRGTGGIKATGAPEIVLDPALTAKILTPRSDAQFRSFAEAMHLMFERGGSPVASAPVPSSSRVDSHNVSNTINGIPIPANAAETYTIAELARIMQIV